MKLLLIALLITSGLGLLNAPLVVLLPLCALTGFIIWLTGIPAGLEALAGVPLTWADGHMVLDPIGGFFLVILSLVCGAVALNMVGEAQSRREAGETDRALSLHLGLSFAFILTMVLTISVRNLGLIWVCIEGTTLISTLLIGSEKKRSSIEAAWKYVILCTVGLSFSLFGLILFVQAGIAAGTAGSLDPIVLVQHAAKLPLPLFKLGFILILVGFGTKAGFAPLHFWLPDAYSQAPTSTSALLSGVLLNCSVYALIRVTIVMNQTGLGSFAQNCLLGFGMVSVLLSTLFLLVQSDLKRLLAYSSVEHIGLIALGLGLGSPLALFATGIHTMAHSLAKSLAFLSAGDMVRYFHSQDMHRMVGTIKRMPMCGGGLALALTALAGIPPFPLFFTELMLVGAALAMGQTVIAIVMLAALVTAFSGLTFHGTRVLLGEDALHHHHDRSEAQDHEHTVVDNPQTLRIMTAGRFWRHTSLVILAGMLMLLPLGLFQPFSAIFELFGMYLKGWNGQ
jgi:hydrogenase-4 component F